MKKAGATAIASGLAALAVAAAGASAAGAALSPASQALFDYAKCMRGKGVKIPDPVKQKDGSYAFPTVSKSITDAAGVREKAQACAASSGAGRAQGQGGAGPGGDGPRGGFLQQSPELQAAFAKFQACLKAAGVTLPGPGDRPQGQRPPAATTTSAASAAKKAGTTTSSKPVVDPKTGKPIAKPTILGQGPDANDDDAQEGFRGGPGGDRGPGGFLGRSTDPKVQAAVAKCRSLLPQGGFGPRGGQGGQQPGAAGTTTAAKTTAKK